MKKILMLAALVAAAATVLVIGTGTASAESDNAAIVIKSGDVCGMYGADADGNPTFGGWGYWAIVVENRSNITGTCKGIGLTNLSGRGQSFKDITCGIVAPSGFYVATRAHATVSASGQGTLTCTYTKP